MLYFHCFNDVSFWLFVIKVLNHNRLNIVLLEMLVTNNWAVAGDLSLPTTPWSEVEVVLSLRCVAEAVDWDRGLRAGLTVGWQANFCLHSTEDCGALTSSSVIIHILVGYSYANNLIKTIKFFKVSALFFTKEKATIKRVCY